MFVFVFCFETFYEECQMINVTNCKAGELVIQAPQGEIDKLLAEVDAPGVTVRRLGDQSNIKKPVPLGIPTMNFRRDTARSEKPVQGTVQNRRSDGKPTPLGVPSMRF